MALDKSEIENLSELLLSTSDENTEIAFAILFGQEEIVHELLTDIFVVYKLTENEDLQAQAMTFLEQVGLDKNSTIIQANVSLKMDQGVTEQKIRKRISTYVLASEGLLDGIKLSIALFKKYNIGLHYILEKASLEQQRFFLQSFMRGTSFKMTDVGLTKIPESLYTFENLTTIDLSNNELVFLPSKINTFKKLRVLNVSKNQLKKLPKTISSLPHLNHLDISYNQLKNFPNEILGMNQLTHLNLVRIHKVTSHKITIPSEFEKLPNILEISMFDHYLTGNFADYPVFTTISQSTPIELNKLSIAELAYQQNQKKEGMNYLLQHSQNEELLHEIIQHHFLNHTQKNIEIKYMKLAKLPLQLADYPIYKISFDSSSFDHQNQEDFFEVLCQLPQLRQAEFHNNNLKTLTPNMIFSKNLQKLSLKDNCLSFLPKEISTLQELKELSLEQNQFTEFPTEIIACKKLKKLSLAHNSLKEFPSEIGELEELEKLYFQCAFEDGKTDLFNIPNSYKKLKKLKIFQFYEDKLQHYKNSSAEQNRQFYLNKLREILPQDCKIILKEF